MAESGAISRAAAAVVLAAWAGAAQSPVTVTVDTQAAGKAIPADFLGLSFEASNLLPEPNGGHLFSAENKPLIDLFRVLGIRSLRIGGSTADMPRYAVPGEKDADDLFAFAAAADLKVIYTLRLPRAHAAKDAAIARYIQQRYADRLSCFEIGNEPDFYRRIYTEIQDYATYRTQWRAIADAVTNTAPGARFCGPTAGGTTQWSRRFAVDFAKSGRIAAVVMHEYPGGDGNLAGGATARDALLSRAWTEQYDRLYESFAAPARANGLPYRLEETNNYTGGAKDATDTFAASLWALDYLHWWAARGASGLNFHNRRWILNTTIYPVDSRDDGLNSGYRIHPIAYGIKAFAVGGHGIPVPVTITTPDALNVAAYAVRGESDLFVTILNRKDPGTAPRDAAVTIMARGTRAPGDAMFLSAPELAAKAGITLGGAAIQDGRWEGEWTPITGAAVVVPGASAVIVKLPLETAGVSK